MSVLTRLRGLLLIVRRSLREHLLSTLVTALSAALGVGLVTAVFCLAEQSRAAFTGGALGFDAVLGARGSRVQLVLNSVFHLETSPGNLPWSAYTDIAARRGVAAAIPLVTGDNVRGFRVVGTSPEFFAVAERAPGEPPALLAGRVFEPERREAVLGASAARGTGLRVGARFHVTHDVSEHGHEHAEEFVVVGVLADTGTPADRVVWLPLEAVFRLDSHVLRGGGTEYRPQDGVPIPDSAKELSAVLLRLRDPVVGLGLDNEINRVGDRATLAWPVDRTVAELFESLGWVSGVLRVVAYLVMLLAAASILASLHNTLRERRREFAVLRALGARRRDVFAVVVLESTAIAFLGALLGLAVHVGVLALAASVVRGATGVFVDVFAWHPVLVLAPLGMTALGACAGLLPAAEAYATDVAANLQRAT